jgi:hypothetical protein
MVAFVGCAFITWKHTSGVRNNLFILNLMREKDTCIVSLLTPLFSIDLDVLTVNL